VPVTLPAMAFRTTRSSSHVPPTHSPMDLANHRGGLDKPLILAVGTRWRPGFRPNR